MNKANPTPNESPKRVRRVEKFIRTGILPRIVLTGMALLAWAMLASVASAQIIQFRAPQLRVTVPINSSGTYILTNTATVRTNGATQLDGTGTNWLIGAINLSATGVPSLPSGLTLNITDPNGNPVSTFTKTISTNGASSSTNLWLQVTANNVLPGTYTISLNANGGATNNILFLVQVAHIWNGSTNAVADGAGNWSDSAQWLGGVPGGDAGGVVYPENQGGQTNGFLLSTAATNNVAITNNPLFYTTNLLVNSIIDNDVTIESLRFAQTNGLSYFQTLQIAPGKTLTINGSNGFSLLRDYVDSLAGFSTKMSVIISGQNATLVVTNKNADFTMLVDNGQAQNLDLANLDNFKATVNHFALGDFNVYPNFFNYNGNGYNAAPAKYLTTMLLAKTNTITAYYVDPYNYTNGVTRQYSFSFLNTAYGSGLTSQANNNVVLGISNAFYMDSINLVGGGQQGNLSFNRMLAGPVVVTNITVTSTNYSVAYTVPMSAYFRNTNGGRMSVFSISDGAGTNNENGGLKANIDFATYGGNLDLLVDRFYIGRDRPVIGGGQNPTYQGTMVMGNGIVDANTAIIGYRQYPGAATNAGNYAGMCEGTLIVSNGVFKVNNLMTLGSTTETNVQGLVFGNNYEFGKLSVATNGTVIANAIQVGGPVYGGSRGNTITMSSSGALVVSNTVASTNQYLDSLSIADGSTLTLRIDGANTNPRIWTTNFVTSTANGINTLKISQLINLTQTFPIQFPLVAYVPGSPSEAHASAFNLVLPGGFVGSLLDTHVNGNLYTLDVTVNTGAPKRLVWRGGNGTWDNATKNWLDQDTGLMTNFAVGDIAAFDDVSGSTITLDAGSSPLIPTAINMTNTTKNFILNGSGFISGGAQLNKWGTGSVEIDASTTVAVQLNQGSLAGSGGAIGGANIASGTTMTFSGNINGGFSCAGAATFLNPGTLNGTIIIQTGGQFTNTGTLNGAPTLLGSSVLCNSNTITFGFGSTMNVASNATFINAGNVTGDNISINGTFKDSGEGTINLYDQLVIGSGGIFMPGGDGVGTTRIIPDGSFSTAFPGRVTFLTGSTNIFKVNLDSGVNYTKVTSGYQDFGPSQGTKAYTGGTLLITNIGVTPITAGLSFQMFGNFYDGTAPFVTGSATNCYPIMLPSVPLPGLAWNINEIVHNGTINTIAVNTNPPNMLISSNAVVNGNIYSNGTNADGSIKYATNNVVFLHLNWPTNRTGWTLQTQVNPTTVGLATNWSTVFSSPWVSDILISNVLSTNSCTFFRLKYP